MNLFLFWIFAISICGNLVVMVESQGDSDFPIDDFKDISGDSNDFEDQNIRLGGTLQMQLTAITEIPQNLMREMAQNVDSVQMAHNKIKRISKKDFPRGCCLNVIYINLHDNFIEEIEDGVFEHLPKLVRVDLSDNLIHKFPNLKAKKLQRLDLQTNIIEKIDKRAMDHYKVIWHLDMRWNKVHHVVEHTFEENKKLIYLNIGHNPLKKVDEYGLPASLENLHLDDTKLSRLPSAHGIKNLKRLSIKKIPLLFTIPDPKKFENLDRIDVTYSMHCCAFEQRELERKNEYLANNNPSDTGKQCNNTIGELSDFGDIDTPDFTGGDDGFGNENDTMSGDSEDFFRDDLMHKYLDAVFGPEPEESTITNLSVCDYGEGIKYKANPVKCNPKPDAFNPCQDVMGTTALRLFSWLISIFAILGNLFQLIILFYSRQELSVYKLLMYNLGFSNLMMGMYLLVLCCVDTYTFGEYYNYVQMWQYSGGCQAFGFIALFATQLSFCSLVLITVERFLLIIFALKVGKQMKLNHAKIAVAAVWFYSFIVAILPVTGKVSSYSKIAICLPVDIPNIIAIGYIVWLLLAYVIAFIVIVVCYVKMYASISQSRPGTPGSTSNQIDVQVAKRMAMIIFSNFLCWLPISIVGFVALWSGLRMNVDVAKFLLVFIFPLNACTNPFLYAIFTRVFRGDTLALLSSCGLCKKAEQNYRNRAPTNYMKSQQRPKHPSAGGGDQRHFMHYEPPVRAIDRFERNIENQTEFDSPETPIKAMIDPNRRQIYDETKPRSDSTRGLLEDKDPRFRSASSDTCSTGMSVQSTDSEVYDEFSRMIGSVKTENYLA